MKFDEIENIVRSKKDFIQFINLLKQDYLDNERDWENTGIDTFLDAMEAWVSDTDLLLEEAKWSAFAKIFYAGSRYE
ncbi:MAG: hypothetical protein ABGX20_11450 [Bacillus sp. (in: firmicutes)]